MNEIIMNEVKVWVGNLGKYNEGNLVGRWIELPIDEDDLEKVLESIGIDNEEYEEIFIADYDIPFDAKELGEYTSIERLNEIAERYNDLEEYEKEVFNEISTDFKLDEAFDIVEDGDYMIYSNCDDMGDVAMQYVEETGLLNNVPGDLVDYFDYQSYGRDMEINGYYIRSSYCDGYIEIIR